MEDEIIKILEDITRYRIFPITRKYVTMQFEPEIGEGCALKISKEQFMKFREWLISKGFTEMEMNTNSSSIPLLKTLLLQLGYIVTVDKNRRGLVYTNNDDTKTVFVNYALDDIVTIYRITYYERV